MTRVVYNRAALPSSVHGGLAATRGASDRPRMPWVRATLRGQRIYARAQADGSLQANGGKVEIRYKPNDGRAYHALPKNLEELSAELLPDDTCATAETAPPKANGNSRESKRPSPIPDGPGDSTTDRTSVYTDGACTGNPGPAGIGVVIVLPESRIEISEYLGEGTNNIAELTAILRGIEEAPSSGHIVIHTDSQYAIGVLSKNWKAKANVELIGAIRERIRVRRKISFVYVPGHAGVPLNERCDQLARQAIRSRGNARETHVVRRIPVGSAGV
jgi:ribonuclease HI